MSSNKYEVAVAVATLILVVYSSALSMLTQVMSPVQTNMTVSSVGSLKAVGVGVYWDAKLANRVSSIDWGVLEPGSSKNVTVYVRNEENLVARLTMFTRNWSPSNASDYLILTWDYGGQSINVGKAVLVTFTLSVSASIKGINSFSFDIFIVGSG